MGDRVAWTSALGSYAESVRLPAQKAVAVPAGIDSRTAAALMLQGMTAQYLCTSTFPLAKGHTCLVHAAAGGVGLLLVQMAKARGARVIGTVSTEAKAALARGAGADEVILYTQEDFLAAVKRLTDGRGVDVVYDGVGKDTATKSLDCLAPRGMMVFYGNASGPVGPIDPLLLSQKGSLFLTRPTLFHYIADRASLEARAADVLGDAAAGRLEVRIDRASRSRRRPRRTARSRRARRPARCCSSRDDGRLDDRARGVRGRPRLRGRGRRPAGRARGRHRQRRERPPGPRRRRRGRDRARRRAGARARKATASWRRAGRSRSAKRW